MNLLEDDEGLQSAYRPGWYGYYSWPAWWSHFNGVGRVTWTAKLANGITSGDDTPGTRDAKSMSTFCNWPL